MKINVYSEKGIKKGSISLPKKYQEKENLALLAQAIRVYENRFHPGLSKTKTRGEISATTRKAYRQKGTGMARHGAKSAPIFVGGGVTHGPKGIKRKLTLPKKMKRKALNVALSLKTKKGEVIAIDNISSFKKTKEAFNLIKNITKEEKNINEKSRFTFVLSGENSKTSLTLRNIKDVVVLPFNKLNAYKIYFGGILVLDKNVFDKKENAKKQSEKESTKPKNKKDNK